MSEAREDALKFIDDHAAEIFVRVRTGGRWQSLSIAELRRIDGAAAVREVERLAERAVYMPIHRVKLEGVN